MIYYYVYNLFSCCSWHVISKTQPVKRQCSLFCVVQRADNTEFLTLGFTGFSFNRRPGIMSACRDRPFDPCTLAALTVWLAPAVSVSLGLIITNQSQLGQWLTQE